MATLAASFSSLISPPEISLTMIDLRAIDSLFSGGGYDAGEHNPLAACRISGLRCHFSPMDVPREVVRSFIPRSPRSRNPRQRNPRREYPSTLSVTHLRLLFLSSQHTLYGRDSPSLVLAVT